MKFNCKTILLLFLFATIIGCVGEEAPTTTQPALTTLPPVSPAEHFPETPTPTASPTTTALATHPPTTEPPITTTPPVQTTAPSTTAKYELTFKAVWSSETHPYDFPSNPHFSPLIGATHKHGTHLFKEGERATQGIKTMAEEGINGPLENEIQTLITEGSACEVITGKSLSPSPGTVTATFTLEPECPDVTLVTMIAPSPDWFVGVNSLSLFADDEWVEEKVVELYPNDAGTDSGSTYSAPNQATNPPETIHILLSEPFLMDGEVPSMGTFTFTRLG